MTHIVHVLLPDIRSAYNVGSIFRSADCFGVSKIFLTGTTPQPIDRFGRNTTGPQKEIAKTALGAEKSIPWEYSTEVKEILKKSKRGGFHIVGVEQSAGSISPSAFVKKIKTEKLQSILLIMGNEVSGISKDILKKCDSVIEISMKGEKESLNVAVCAGVVMYGICS
ncbi:MAG: hypothetical protein RJB39_544 [Candidatus Parcubacteria bacterium]|jgi:tRNA G18 (ribose-2'-O)-methylase SpoU